MKKRTLITVTLTVAILVLFAVSSWAGSLTINNTSKNIYSIIYDTWILGIKNSHTAMVGTTTIVTVQVPILSSLGEMRIYLFKEAPVSSTFVKALAPSGIWSPLRWFRLNIASGSDPDNQTLDTFTLVE
jgi:hypothetical protein